MDAGFLYMETPTLHMHTIKVVVLHPTEDPAAALAAGGRPLGAELPIEFVREQVSKRLDRLPPLRRRLVEVPFGFHHPLWIDDPDLDIEFHVRRVIVPSPGGPGELDAVVADVASRPLDRRRPLWEMHVCEGLADGKVGVIVKVHHCVADGVAAAALLANVMSDGDLDEPSGGPDRHRARHAPWHPESQPSSLWLLADALVDHTRQIGSLPSLVVRTVGNLIAVVGHLIRSGIATPKPVIDAPRTSFNGALTPHRSFASTSLPLGEVKRIKSAFGTTLNDVVLALCAGALRSYLSARGELPERALLAGVPISADQPGDEPRLAGNKVSNLITTLATDEDDPVRRLRAIHDVTVEAKKMQALLGVDTLRQWVQYTPPRPYAWLVRRWSRLRVADQLPPPINVVVSNVPGPRRPLTVAAARLEHLFSVGPVLEGVGLNVTFWSYGDRLDVGILGCREAVPHPDLIAKGLHLALAELGAAADAFTVPDTVKAR